MSARERIAVGFIESILFRGDEFGQVVLSEVIGYVAQRTLPQLPAHIIGKLLSPNRGPARFPAFIDGVGDSLPGIV
jgi:hypothetical protein